MAGPYYGDQDIGPLLQRLGYTWVNPPKGYPPVYGPTAIWKGKDANQHEAMFSQLELANQVLGDQSPYSSKTIVLGGRRYAMDQETGQHTVDLGPVGVPPVNQGFTGAGLPPGFIQDAKGIVYRQDNGALRLATNAELADIGPVGAGSGAAWHGFAPTHQSYTDERTGDRVFVTDGVEQRRIPGASWAALSPQQQFDQATAIRQQADDALMARQNAGDVAAGQRNMASDLSKSQSAAATEAGINDRYGFGAAEASVMDRATLAENARKANLESATRAFGDVTAAAAPLGTLALANAGFTRDVLKSAPDYLARAFFQQGQASPLPQVSQADIINQLRSNISGFNSTLQGLNPQVGTFAPPPAAVPFGGGVGRAPVAVGGVVTQTAAQDAAAMAAARAAGFGAPAAPVRGAQGGAGAATAGFDSAPPPVYDRPPADAAPDTTPGYTMGVNGPVLNADEILAGAQWAPTPEPAALPPPPPPDRFATGGFTHAPVMRVGEAPSGVPNATEEMVVNPTGAPIGVVPNAQTQTQGQPQPQQAVKDPVMVANEAKVKALSKIMGFVENPQTLHAIVDELTVARAKTRRPIPGFARGTTPRPDIPTAGDTPDQPTAGASAEFIRGFTDAQNGTINQAQMASPEYRSGVRAFVQQQPGGATAGRYLSTAPPAAVPGFANGTGLFGFSVPQTPMPLEANQSDIQALERRVRPPALNTLFSGQTPNAPQFGFNLFTPTGLGALTPDDRDALGTTLATQYNETLPNVESAIKDRWSTGNRRMASAAGF